ncbi:MAG: bifunctional hydroxymethylpyrimidine kinase/phosphomethylpyrimidine kinase [Chloroflexi bacterium]|nr:bifunctional hydroxymethylpyrimidine kinase/phosphomethylpyrimidine kinase [Chloroflexota bacterium]
MAPPAPPSPDPKVFGARPRRVPVALAIAGSDSGGGAGVQADLKAFATLGVHGMSAIAALTAQNTQGVFGVVEVDPQFVGQQIDVVVQDLGVDATKTGMLASAPIIEVVAAKIREHNLRPLVVDPVMVAKGGDPLLHPDAMEVLRETLIPLATVITPNLPEAEAICQRPVNSLEEMHEAARIIHDLGPQYVVVKGGHLVSEPDAVDVLFDGSTFQQFRRQRFETPHTHGTGCMFASAIAAGLAARLSVPAAVDQAKDLVTEAVRYGLALGRGRGPANTLAILYERAGLLPGREAYDPFSG